MVDQTKPPEVPISENLKLERKVEELELVLGSLVSLLIRKDIIGEEEFVAHVDRTRTLRGSSRQDADSNSSATIPES